MITSPYPKEDLGELCYINIGKTPSRHNPAYWGSGHPWLSIADMSKRELQDTKEQITDIAIKECGCRIVPENTLLMSFKLSIGKLGFTQKPMFTNEAIVSLPVKDPKKLAPEYLYRALQVADLLSGTDRAVMGATLNKDKLYKIKIPLPPLDEQKRIARMLDKADAIRHKRAESQKLLDELLRASFLGMFGESEGKGWNETVVGKTTDKNSGSIRTGPFGSQLLHSEFVGKGIAVLGIDNAVRNEFRWAKPRFISPEKYQQLKRYTVRPGDVLITIMGTCGRCAIVPSDCPTAINTKHLCCITLDQNVCLPEFLHSFFLLHPKAKYYLKKTAKGAIMDGLNMAIIKAMPIVLPPIDLQRQYQDIWYRIQESKKKLALHESESDTLLNSLIARAFKGEL